MRWLIPRRRTKRAAEEDGRIVLASNYSKRCNRDGIQYVAKSKLPGEGRLFDPIGIGNFLDLDKNKFTAGLNKTFRSNILSNIFDVDLPAKLTFGGKLGTLWLEGLNVSPVGKASLSVQLLDLGASDSRQSGWLRYKASVRTNGRADHGFEIDRRISVLNMQYTTLYGNVNYKTSNKAGGAWKSTSSFGVHQDFRLAGLRFAARVGMTPEGEYVGDLRL